MSEYDNIGYFKECCLNCYYWNIYRGRGVICEKGHGNTCSDDSCDQFYLLNNIVCLSGGGYSASNQVERELKLDEFLRLR